MTMVCNIFKNFAFTTQVNTLKGCEAQANLRTQWYFQMLIKDQSNNILHAPKRDCIPPTKCSGAIFGVLRLLYRALSIRPKIPEIPGEE